MTNFPAIEAELASSIINSAKQLPNYKSGGNRIITRTQTSLKSGSSGWTKQDINTLFKTGTYSFIIPVRGKTDDYMISIEIDGFIDDLNIALKKQPFTPNTIQIALQKAVAIKKIRISCNCPDFTYRYSYSQTLAGNKAGEPQSVPSIKTNPNNIKGACKHIVAVLSNKSWIPQISTNLHTYIMTIYNRNRTLFDSIIRPSLNNITDAKIENKPEPPEGIDTSSTEQINGSYCGAQQYNQEQNLMISVAAESGADVQPFITPENTPEQIWEISKAYKLGLPIAFIQKLTNVEYSPMIIAVLASINKSYNLDWTRFDTVHPAILTYLATHYEATGLSPKDFGNDITIGKVQKRIKEILE